MRILASAIVSAVAMLSLVSADEAPYPKEDKQLLLWITQSRIDQDENPFRFAPEFRAQTKLIDIEDIRGWKGFKPLMWLYIAGSALESYNDDDSFRFRRMRREPSLSMNFETESGQRITFAPSSRPAIAFPLARDGSFDSILAIQIISEGVAITFRTTLGPPRPRQP